MSEPPAADLGARPSWIALATDGPVLSLPDAVRVVADPATFVALLERARPHIAVVNEPPANPALLDHLALERRRRPSLRIVHLAAIDAYEARLHALRLGFDESLPGSIDPDELRGRLALLDQRARPRGTDPIPVGNDLVLDLVAHELRRDGRTVHLRPKEFGLLAMLAAHPGRAYTRRRDCWTGSGARSMRAIRALSTSTSDGSARRSSPNRRDPSTSSLCAGSATGWIRRSPGLRGPLTPPQPPEPATAVNGTLTNQQTRVDGATRR